ncbi:ATP-binding protein [Actinomadura kijaniata]|uniref:ATP-binding protein n=1 Tax=Actinomadura kijaniata TaxID=46161 RepID=UPI0008313FDF|nr:tetratricopeptide repeat protein [Actinomadura kijaniata]
MASPQAWPGNLPAETSSFIGRRDELAEVRRTLDRARLVTLLGPGGVGKTRLALRAASGVRQAFPGGVWLVELSALRAPELIAHTVAQTLRLPGPAAGDPVDLLADHLADAAPTLLVLDTCEHLVHACAMLAETLLTVAPALRILATSRESLNTVGEYTVLVAPLEVPRTGDPEPDGCDSVELFAERAAACRPGFALARHNRAAVAQLCRRLEGIPLALELAAVGLRAMPIEQMVERLDDRFRLLGPARTGEHRHRTLRTAITWSHDLCVPPERMLWARLSVFPGGFDLEAVERVCTDEHLPVGELLDVLTMLVDKSIVRFDPSGPRYRMLDTLREFGTELLERSGEAPVLHERHRDHYAALAERAVAGRRGDRQLAWVDRLQEEDDNLRAALEWSLATPGQERAGLRLAVLLCDHWFLTGRLGEGLDWYRRALAAVPGRTFEHGRALYGAGLYAILRADPAEAGALLAEALAVADAAGDPDLRAHALHELGRCRFHVGDLDGALDLYRRARRGYREAGARSTMSATIHADLASVHAVRGDHGRAHDLCEEGIAACAAAGERWGRAVTVLTRAATHWLGGACDRAVSDVRDCLPVLAAFDNLRAIARSLDLLMVCAATTGDHERAAVLAGAAESLWERHCAPDRRGVHYVALRAAGVDAARRGLGGERFGALLARGRAMPTEQAVAFALDG